MSPYYVDEAVTIFHADCREIMPMMEGFQHVITDPPYSEWVHAKVRRGGSVRAIDRTDGGPKKPVISTAAVLGFAAIDAATRIDVAMLCARAERWSLVFSDVESHHLWRDEMGKAGVEYIRCGMWVKIGATPQFTGDRPASGVEAITIGHRRCKKRWNGGGRHAVWSHQIVGGQGRLHTTQKPESLMRELVVLFTEPGDLIIDPFGGSGTTAYVAKQLGRRCVLIERDEKYCEVAAKRMAQGALALFA